MGAAAAFASPRAVTPGKVKLEKMEKTEAFVATCDKCGIEVTPGKMWYHIYGSCRDLCFQCLTSLQEQEQQTFKRIYTPRSLRDDMDKYRVAVDAPSTVRMSAYDAADDKERRQC